MELEHLLKCSYSEAKRLLILYFLCRFWIDTADKQPCIGTGGIIPWKLRVAGKLFHSGLAHKVFQYSVAISVSPVLNFIVTNSWLVHDNFQ